jgi:hypothetical protein
LIGVITSNFRTAAVEEKRIPETGSKRNQRGIGYGAKEWVEGQQQISALYFPVNAINELVAEPRKEF